MSVEQPLPKEVIDPPSGHDNVARPELQPAADSTVTREAPRSQGEESTEDRYSPEAIKEDINHKISILKKWASEQGLAEGRDIVFIENIGQMDASVETAAPHELKQFFVIVDEKYYDQFKQYILGAYSELRRSENPENRWGGPKLDYSWGGRFAVGWDGAPFDTAPAEDITTMTAKTHQQEFKQFYFDHTGEQFPTSEQLNPILKEICALGLPLYMQAREKLVAMRNSNALADDGYGLLDAVDHAILILQDAQSGEAVVDLPETLIGNMPAKIRHYADVTYNAEHIEQLNNYDRIAELTGIMIPQNARLTEIYRRLHISPKSMDGICKDFAEYLTAKRTFEKSKQ